MLLRKKWFGLFLLISIAILLGACGGREKSEDVVGQGESQDISPRPLSEALDKHKVWVATGAKDPKRDSQIREIYVFENGTLKYYENPDGENYLAEDFTLEDVVEMSDAELIQFAKANGKEVNVGEYILDIKLDEYGNNTEKIYLFKKETGEKLGFFDEGNMNITLFNQQYAGFGVNIEGRRHLLTRVDNSYTTFLLDGPNTKAKNVTLEKADEMEEAYKKLLDEQQATIETEDQLKEDEQQEKTEKGENGLKAKYLQKADALHAKILEAAEEAGVDLEMGGFYGQYYAEWDGLLNELWGVLKETLPEEEFKILQDYQEEWIILKETTFEEMPDETASARRQAEDYLAYETKNRIYFLIDNYLP